MAPRRPQDDPKTTPRRLQAASNLTCLSTLPPSCLQVFILPAIFRQVASKLPPRWPQEASRWQLGPSWPHPGPPLSAKNIKKTHVCVCFCYFAALPLKMPRMAQRWPQECPRRPQDGPRSRQDGPKTAPRPAKAAPRRPQDDPKTTPRRPQDGPRRLQTPPRRLQDDPKIIKNCWFSLGFCSLSLLNRYLS